MIPLGRLTVADLRHARGLYGGRHVRRPRRVRRPVPDRRRVGRRRRAGPGARGAEPGTTDPYLTWGGKAVCKCHPVDVAKELEIERFECEAAS